MILAVEYSVTRSIRRSRRIAIEANGAEFRRAANLVYACLRTLITMRRSDGREKLIFSLCGAYPKQSAQSRLTRTFDTIA